MNSFITYNVIMHLICVVIDLDLQPCMFLQFTSTWSQMLAVHREFCLLHLISYCVHHFQYVFHKKFHKGQNQYGPKCQWTRAQSKTLCFLLISNTCDYWNELKYPVASIYHTHTTFKQNQIQYMAPTDGQKHYCWMFDKADKIIYANHRRQMQRGVILKAWMECHFLSLKSTASLTSLSLGSWQDSRSRTGWTSATSWGRSCMKILSPLTCPGKNKYISTPWWLAHKSALN